MRFRRSRIPMPRRSMRRERRRSILRMSRLISRRIARMSRRMPRWTRVIWLAISRTAARMLPLPAMVAPGGLTAPVYTGAHPPAVGAVAERLAREPPDVQVEAHVVDAAPRVARVLRPLEHRTPGLEARIRPRHPAREVRVDARKCSERALVLLLL